MKQQGRVSAANLSTVSKVTDIARLRAPAYVSEEIKSVWVQIVNSKPADFFGKEHEGLLEALCHHIINAQKISKVIEDIGMTWVNDDEALKRLEKLQKMHRVQSNAIETIMRAMRLTHQAIYRADKAPKPNSAKNRPWIANEKTEG